MYLNTFEMHAKCMFTAFKMYFQGMFIASQSELKYVFNAFSIHVACSMHLKRICIAWSMH